MAIRIEAIYEDGKLTPLQPLALPEHEVVTLDILPAEDDRIDLEFLNRCRQELVGVEKLSFEQMHDRLAGMQGSFEEVITSERDRR